MLKSAVTALLMVGLSACSGEGTGPAASSAPPVAQPVKGGIFRQGLVRVASLDPARASTVSERVLADQLYDGLTSWDPVSGATRPAVAIGWESAEANKIWTFRLRPDAKAANGEAITAADVKLSLEQAVRPLTPVSDLLAPVVGFGAFATDLAVPGLTGITTPDNATVRVELTTSFSGLPSLLGNPAFGIKHRRDDGVLIGTGPFTVTATNGDQGVSLVPSAGATTFLDRIETSFFPDLDAAYAAFESGSLDWVPVSPALAVQAGRKHGGHLYRTSLRSVYLSLNTQQPEYANPRYRQAIIRSIDRAGAVRAADGDVRLLNGINTDAVPERERSNCGSECSYDITAARSLLAALFPGAAPPPMTINVLPGPPITEAVHSQIVRDLAITGISARVRTLSAEEFSALTVSDKRDVLQTGWSAAYPSAEATIPPLFLSNSPANLAGFRDAEIDRRILEAQAMTDDAKRAEAFVSIERDILMAVPVIPLMQFPVASVAAPTVRGLAVQPTGNFDASAVWLAPAP